MKKLVKIGAALAAIVIAVCGCSKSYDHIAGYDVVSKAKQLYASLNSAHVKIKDNNANLITQDFLYKYNGDTLVYCYIGTDGEKTYYEYNNGSELNYTDSTMTQWNFYDMSAPEFYSYSRSQPHPMASQTAISINADSIVDGGVADNPDGSKLITYHYDAAQLNSYASSLSTVGTLVEFTTTLCINPDGYCTELSQLAILEVDGKQTSVDYTMTIDEMNKVEKVELPKACWEK